MLALILLSTLITFTMPDATLGGDPLPPDEELVALVWESNLNIPIEALIGFPSQDMSISVFEDSGCWQVTATRVEKDNQTMIHQSFPTPEQCKAPVYVCGGCHK